MTKGNQGYCTCGDVIFWNGRKWIHSYLPVRKYDHEPVLNSDVIPNVSIMKESANAK